MSRFPKLLELLKRKQVFRAGDRGGGGQAPGQRRRLVVEPLEDRVLFSTTIFLDFGGAVGMGDSFDATAAEYRDILGANTGTDLTDDGIAAGGTLRFTPLAYDFERDGDMDNADITALANAVLPLAQRALEPFDIDVVLASAANLGAVDAIVDANDGDMSGRFDAYVFVMTVTSDGFADAIDGGNFISVGAQTQLFGEAAATDLNAQSGNDTDEAALTFADNVFGSVSVAVGNATFNARLAQRLAYTAVHEAFHTFTYVHTPDESNTNPQASNDQRLLTSGDVIRRGSVTREDPFIVTRYTLQHGIAVAQPNNYLLAATDADIGLRDDNASGRPDLAYVTGTGANDIITLANGGGAIVNVDVDPFNNQGRTTAIGAGESYAINLATDTDGTILVDASVNADEVRVDATIATPFRLRGGEGADGSAGSGADADLLTLQANGKTGTYTPGATAESGAVSYGGGASITWSEFENAEANGIPVVVNPLILSTAVLSEGCALDLSGSFVALDTQDIHQVTINWGDGSANTVLNIAAGLRAFASSHVYRDDNPTGTSFDPYQITVTITDGDDGSGSANRNVTVNNVAPTVATIAFSDAEIDESESVTVTGTFTDPALGQPTESFTGTAVWSDGVATLLTVNADGTFATSRTFLDDHPSTGTLFDLFTVDITISDDDLGADSLTSGVLTVYNVDPVITAFASDATFEDKGEEGEPVTVNASFSDIGILDTHTAVIDWGDGSVEAAPVAQGAGSGTVQSQHAYAAGGIYTVTITVTDDDTGSHQASTLAVITGVGLNNGILYVIGSAADDSAHVHLVGKGTLRVHASFIPEPYRDFAVANVDQIISYLCRGDDRLTIAGSVTTPAIVHGDRGDDHLHGGGGSTVLIGGRDDDMLIGQSGLDVLIGGLGADRAVGGSGEDVLIGGQTTYDHNQDAALTAALAIWTDPLASYEDRVTALDGYLTVIDDLEPDKLTGSAGRDLFYAGTGDVVTDQKANESDAGLMMLAQAAPGTGQVALLADAPAPVIDWSRPGEAGAPLAALPAWTSDFVNDGAQGEAERKRNGGFVVKIPAAPTAPVKG